MTHKKIIFLSQFNITPLNIHSNNIYTSLLVEFIKNGHEVYVINPMEKRLYKGDPEGLIKVDGVNYINVRIGNLTKTNKIEKGITTVNIERIYVDAVKKYLSDVKFDLILYPTPPITFYKAIKYLKDRDGALTYLMLKDIFPQNAVDLNFFSSKSLFYKYFRRKEIKLYEISDYIGCMSKANVDYLLNHNPKIKTEYVEVLPNSIEPIDLSLSNNDILKIREKYNLPTNKRIFIYGGNLGKPQGIDFLMECIECVKDLEDIFFLIIGNGTEYEKICKYKEDLNLNNVVIMERLNKKEFDLVAASSDVGILSLDYRFTIPNYPSRLLTYMQVNLPVFAITDVNTDVGLDITEGEFGWWANQHSVNEVRNIIIKILDEYDTKSIEKKKLNSYNYLKDNFDIYNSYKKIVSKL